MIKRIERLTSLDVFRGLTVIYMILVNSPGNNQAYASLEHSAWNGCTLADLVFPFFLFIVGLSISFAFKLNPTSSDTNKVTQKIFRRTLELFLIGVFINLCFNFDLANLRYFGVLQRIAICYGVVAWLYISTSTRTLSGLTVAILVLYALLYSIFPPFSMEDNPAAYIDRLLFASNHLYGKVYDPEGLLSTFPSIATTLFGCLTGRWVQNHLTRQQQFKGLVVFALVCLVAGAIWQNYLPLNKALWSSSYVVWTSGWALLIFAGIFWLQEIKCWHQWSSLFSLFGKHALFIYIFHVLLLKLQAKIHFIDASQSYNLRTYITHLFFESWNTPANASLYYSLLYIGFCFLVLFIKEKRAFHRQLHTQAMKN